MLRQWDKFFIRTLNQIVDRDAAYDFVTRGRNAGLEELNIASLVAVIIGETKVSLLKIIKGGVVYN